MKNHRILLIGHDGQVGWELHRTLATLGKIIHFNKQELDLSQPSLIREKIQEVRPSIIVNAAAYTAVDKAEAEPALARAINERAPGVIAEEAKKLDALIVHYSTDYIFNGQSQRPYTEHDAPEPLNEYGASKLAGDQAIIHSGCHYFIFRTTWVYGARGHNFLLTMLRLAKERTQLKIINDQIGAPTWSRLIAEASAQILMHHQPHQQGIYNLTSSGATSWHGFASTIFKLLKEVKEDFTAPEVLPIPTSEYPTPAKRPHYSILCHDKLEKNFAVTMPDWEDSLKLCIGDMHAYKLV